MILQEIWLPALISFLLGVLFAWLAASLISSRRSAARRLRDAERVSAAEALAESEESRRRELEQELEETQEAQRELDRRLAVADERVGKARETIEEQRQFLESSRKELEATFQALAGRALKGQSEQFLTLAEQRLAASRTQAAADLEERKQAIANLLEPLHKTLQQLDSKTGDMEKARVDAYSRIDEQIRQLSQATVKLQDETTSLSSALRGGSQVRGRWGEIALRNVVELAGMTEHCDFEEQTQVSDGKRPDMTVRLPEGRAIAVDAKVPLTAYLEAVEAGEESAREAALDRHSRTVRSRVKELAARDYADSIEGDIDLVVMFLPGDPFLATAFARDPDLQVDALRSKVLIATPTTLLALLRTVAIYWQQRALAENAEAIADAARELYDRAAKFGEELAGVGKGLKSALDAYNRAAGSFDRRLMPMSRRLEEMQVSEQARRKLTAPDPLDQEPRTIAPPPDDE